MDVARLGQLYHWFNYPYHDHYKKICATTIPKLGGAIMAGEGSTSAPSECFWWQVGVEEWHGLREKESQRSEKHTILGARTESSLGPSEGLDVTSSLFCFWDGCSPPSEGISRRQSLIRIGVNRVTNPGGWMTPSPLDRKTKANEAEPRWRDRLVLTRVSPITKFEFLTSLCLNGATGGDAEATRVGLVRYDIKRSRIESKAQKGSEGSVPPMQCGMARS
ncbi:hypothetical protein VNO77_47108 [Canavalia gladiata]|uniref:Uncharacterized protein n=1 Tax=Canavalia gladiata TaxID=3824 RepID=A0AAN9JI89_CANGL